MPSIKYSMIHSNVKFASDQSTVTDVVTMMVEYKISSVLIHNGKEEIVGIVTERDIVRKFTLLDMSDKLLRLVATIMTRGVFFARLNHLHEDIIKLHLEKKIRHFPILSHTDPIKAHVVGMVSVTDFLKKFILQDVPEDLVQVPLALLLANQLKPADYLGVFQSLGFKTESILDLHEFLKAHMGHEIPCLFDVDGFTEASLKHHIQLLISYKGPIVFAASNPSTVSLLRKYLKGTHQCVAIKPVDFSYCQWFFTKLWLQQHARSQGFGHPTMRG